MWEGGLLLAQREPSFAVHDEVSYLAFRPQRGRIFLFRYTENQLVICIFQFRFQHVDPGDVEVVAPLRESIQLFEWGAVDTIFQYPG